MASTKCILSQQQLGFHLYTNTMRCLASHKLLTGQAMGVILNLLCNTEGCQEKKEDRLGRDLVQAFLDLAQLISQSRLPVASLQPMLLPMSGKGSGLGRGRMAGETRPLSSPGHGCRILHAPDMQSC